MGGAVVKARDIVETLFMVFLVVLLAGGACDLGQRHGYQRGRADAASEFSRLDDRCLPISRRFR